LPLFVVALEFFPLRPVPLGSIYAFRTRERVKPLSCLCAISVATELLGRKDRISRVMDWEIGRATGSPNECQARRRIMASKTNPFTFLQQVRTEVSKVTWPSRRETGLTTLMVFAMVIFAALFFLLVDQTLGFVVKLLLDFGK
jgi:preprotein translocase subunit SecE